MGIVHGAEDSKDAGNPCLQKGLWSEQGDLQVNTPRSVLHNREKCPGCQENREEPEWLGRASREETSDLSLER